MSPTPLDRRRRDLAALADGPLDVLVVGGGIVGSGAALDAATRGLRVGLVERDDLAVGTSSRSSRLIHGGLRYLEQYRFGLVREALRERSTILHLAPHLVTTQPLLFPLFGWPVVTRVFYQTGMTLYDVLAMYRNVAAHRTLSASAAHELEPALRTTNLRGAIRYFDCQEDDARFCIDNILHAAQLGAACVNYCEVVGFRQENNLLVPHPRSSLRASEDVVAIVHRCARYRFERNGGHESFDFRIRNRCVSVALIEFHFAYFTNVLCGSN